MDEELERRTYLRDPEGSTTGGQFTRNPAGAQHTQLTYKGTQGDLGRRPRKGKVSAKAGKPVTSSFQTLRVGADNDPAVVRDVQRLLGQLGIRTGGPQENGVYDEATEAAVKLAQQRLGIKNPNGRADRALVSKLLAAYDLSPCIQRSEDLDAGELERRNFNPLQPRIPHGPGGGRWSLTGAIRDLLDRAEKWHTDADLDDVTGLARSITSGTRKVGPLTYGGRSHPHLTEFGDGTERVVTTYPSLRDADADQLSSALGRAIGIPAPRRMRVDDDISVSELVDGTTWAEREDQILNDVRAYERESPIAPISKREPTSATLKRQQADLERQRAEMLNSDAAMRVGVLDLLTGVDERHNGTLVVTPSGVVPVESDTGWTYADGRYRAAEVAGGRASKANGKVAPVERRTASQNLVMWSAFSNLRSWRDSPLTPADVAFLRAKLDAQQPQYAKLGRLRWWQFASDRLDALASHAKGSRNLFAPDASALS